MTVRHLDTLRARDESDGPCPRCREVSSFRLIMGRQVLQDDSPTEDAGPVYERSDLLACTGCGQTTVVVTEFHGDQKVNPLRWYPAPGAGQLDPNVDRKVAACYDEAMRCLSIGANRAAAAMFRAALHRYVDDKGKEWADYLHQINSGANAEDYDDMTQSEARAAGEFVRHLIRHEYEMPAQLRRADG